MSDSFIFFSVNHSCKAEKLVIIKISLNMVCSKYTYISHHSEFNSSLIQIKLN